MNFNTIRLRSFASRQQLSTRQLAAILGVPTTTAAKWLAGTRNPSGAAVRLFYVLLVIEADYPDLLTNLKAESFA